MSVINCLEVTRFDLFSDPSWASSTVSPKQVANSIVS